MLGAIPGGARAVLAMQTIRTRGCSTQPLTPAVSAVAETSERSQVLEKSAPGSTTLLGMAVRGWFCCLVAAGLGLGLQPIAPLPAPASCKAPAVTLGLPEGQIRSPHHRKKAPSQPAGRQRGCNGVFWVKLFRELLKCFVLMMAIVIFFSLPLRHFWNSLLLPNSQIAAFQPELE